MCEVEVSNVCNTSYDTTCSYCHHSLVLRYKEKFQIEVEQKFSHRFGKQLEVGDSKQSGSARPSYPSMILSSSSTSINFFLHSRSRAPALNFSSTHLLSNSASQNPAHYMAAAGKRSRTAELQDESSKKRCFDGSSSPIKSCIIYIVPNKLSSGHNTHLKSVALKKQFLVTKEDK